MQALSSEQVVAAPDKQTPLPQLSPMVHALPSLQVGVTALGRQPSTGSQTRLVHTPAPAQSLVTPGWQAPLAQPSLVVHALPSSQGAALFADWQPRVGKQ